MSPVVTPASSVITITKVVRKRAKGTHHAQGKRVAVHVADYTDPHTKKARKLYSYMLAKHADYFGFPSSGVMASDVDKNGDTYWWRPNRTNPIKVPKEKVKSTTAGAPDKQPYASIPMPREMRIEDISKFLATATKHKPNSFAVKSGRHYAVDATPTT